MLKPVKSIAELEKRAEGLPVYLVYAGSNHCSVCQNIRPRVEAMLQETNHIPGFDISVDHVPEFAGQFLVFVLPAILVFHWGKEVYRTARFIDLDQLALRLNEIPSGVKREKDDE